jgi:hypothetical protein
MARTTRTSEDELKTPSPEPEIEQGTSNGATEDDEFAVDTAIPSPELGDLGDLQAFAADDDDVARDDAETLYCSTGRPESDAYIRAYPDTTWWKDLWVLEYTGADNRKTTYLVHNSLRKLEELEGKVKRKCAVPYIPLSGGIGLWLIGADYGDNPWVASAMRCCRRAIDNGSCRYRGEKSVRTRPDLPMGSIPIQSGRSSAFGRWWIWRSNQNGVSRLPTTETILFRGS